MTGIGLMIGELGFSAVRCGPVGEESKLIESDACHAPMTVLVPRLPGEPLRLDCVIPLHPRGTGCEWPPEAGIDDERGCGRFPLAAAWAGLPQDRPGLPHGRDWVWHIDGREQAVRPAEAIATAVTDILSLHPTLAGCGVPTLVIPNSTREAEQQALLDAARHAGVKLQLLWRPVAAALAWCHRFDDFLRERVSQGAFTLDESIGRLACLHVGLALVELTVLDLVATRHEGQVWITPARRRPDPDLDVTAGLGWLVLEEFAKRFLSSAGLAVDRQHLWQILFASNWPSSWLASFEAALPPPSQTVTMPTGLSIPANDARPRYLPGLPIRQGDGQWQFLGPHVLPQSSPDQLPSWSSRCRQQLPDDVIGAVVSGEMAAVPLKNEVPLGRALLERILGPPQRLLLGGEFLGRRFLTQGAAMFSARLAAGLPAYLDTLPRLQLLVIRPNGEMVWTELLRERDAFVPGGQPWRRSEPVSGLAIPRGRTDLSFDVFHEEFPGVRKVRMELPRTCPTDEPVKLHVSITPAQGNATLEARPENPAVFGTRAFLVDWKSMKEVKDENGVPVGPQDYIERQPPIFPALLPRLHSPAKWTAARGTVERLLGAPRNDRTRLLFRLLQKLQQKDPEASRQGRDATAVGSDGRVTFAQELLNQFVAQSWAWRATASPQFQRNTVRTLAYASADLEDLRKFLLRHLNIRGNVAGEVLLASGHCLRRSEDIVVLADQFIARFSPPHGPMPNNNWLRALSEVLRYREHAPRDFTAEQCNVILESCLRVLDEQMEIGQTRGRVWYKFKNAALVIAFLLRRRAFDPSFLDPTTDLADRIKTTFRRAIKAHESKQVVIARGSINVPEALQQMIDYIDRRGSGTLLLAAPDETEENDMVAR